VLDWDSTVEEYSLDLRSANRSPATIINYRRSLDLFAAWVDALPDPPETVADVTKGMVTGWIAQRLDQEQANTTLTRFRALRAFWNWAEREEIVDRSPMVHVREPSAPLEPPDVLSEDQLRALLDTCRRDKTFMGRRDFSLLALMAETGVRVGEAAGLTVGELDPGGGTASVLGKGRRRRTVAIGTKTGKSLLAYFRERSKHKLAADPHVWLGQRGPLKPSAMWEIVRDRGLEAGIDGMYPHRLRHTMAHRFRMLGGDEGDLAVLGGWRSPEMLARYGASAAAERAVAAHRRIDPLAEIL
jgi:site-specific recombinase XerD